MYIYIIYIYIHYTFSKMDPTPIHRRRKEVYAMKESNTKCHNIMSITHDSCHETYHRANTAYCN